MTDPKLTPREPTPDFHNPWRDSLENCISGDNYLRAQEYRALIEELDDLYRLRAMHDAAPTVEADATPELLKAVRSVIAWYEAEDDHSKADFYKRLEMCRESETLCRAAIAKAEGHPAAPQPAALPELSDAEIGRLVDRMDNTHDSDLLKFARAVIAAMKGKQ